MVLDVDGVWGSACCCIGPLVGVRAGRRGRFSIAGAVFVVVFAVMAGPALGAPFRLPGGAPGSFPALGLGADGVGHVVFDGPSGGGADSPLRYCRVPFHAGRCTSLTTLLPTGLIPTADNHNDVFVNGSGEVVVTSAGMTQGPSPVYERFAVRSMDGGLSFGAPVLIDRSATFSIDPAVPALAPNGLLLSLAFGAQATTLRARPLDGSGRDDSGGALFASPGPPIADSSKGSSPRLLDGAVGFDGQDPVVVRDVQAEPLQVRRYVGPGGYEDPGAWGPITTPAITPPMASGPAGLFAATTALPGQDYRVAQLTSNGLLGLGGFRLSGQGHGGTDPPQRIARRRRRRAPDPWTLGR